MAMERFALITTVCLNPSIDHMIAVDGLVCGGLNRVRASRFDAGGKGLNVAVAVSALGGEAECVGFLDRESARLFETRLRKSGAGYDFIWRKAPTRTNLKVFDRSCGVVTEFNAPGEAVSEEEIRRMSELIAHRARRADVLVLSGSMPPACPANYYAGVIRAVAGEKCLCVLDADGAPLREGIEARPWLIKPNRAELEALVGRPLPGATDVRDAAREIVARGVGVVAVSLGADGALIADAREAFFAPPLKIAVRSTVGAGDCMVAGLVCGFSAGKDLREAFSMGVAAASAMCMTDGSEPPARGDFEALLQTVHTERI